MRLLNRFLQRLLILGLGVFSVWIIVFVVFDTADQRLPWVLAVSLTYGIAAYVVLPRVIRIGLMLLHRKRVPSFTTTGDGLPGDPANVALIGTLAQLRAAFAALGWSEADRLGLASSWGMIRAFVFNSPYPTAPFSTLYLFGRGQDVGFPGQRVQVNGFDWDAPHRAPRSISWTEQWHFGAGSHNRCGSRSSEHIQKRQRHPPPSRSVNLNSLPWAPPRSAVDQN